MDKSKVIKQMKDIIDKEMSVASEVEDVEKSDFIFENNEWVKSLPKLQNDEFILSLEDKGVVVCINELDWYTQQNIEVFAYRKRKLSDGKYYAGEYECREILSRAIVWVADILNKEIVFNESNNILNKLPDDIIDVIWSKYYPKINLTAKEANALYSAALSYFRGDVEDKPIPAIIIEFDMIVKIGRLSREEIRNIKTSDMQRMKLILKARAEALKLNAQTNNENSPSQSKDELLQQVLNLPDNIRPPGLQGIILPK